MIKYSTIDNISIVMTQSSEQFVRLPLLNRSNLIRVELALPKYRKGGLKTNV